MAKVLDNYGIISVPFKFNVDKSVWNDIESLMPKKMWFKKYQNGEKDFDCRYLNNNIVSMFTNSGDSKTICKLYEINQDYLSNLPQDDKLYAINCDNRLSIISKRIIIENGKEIEKSTEIAKANVVKTTLLLFYSNIGFLNFVFHIDTDSIEKFTEAMYLLNQAKRKEFVELSYSVKRKKHTTYMYELIPLLINYFPECSSFDTDTKNFVNPDFLNNNILSFSNLILDKYSSNIPKYAVLIGNNQRDSYLSIINEKDLFRPFENRLWAISLNGVACIENMTGKEKSDRYFFYRLQSDNFSEKFNLTYFYLFLLRQHQRYYLRHKEEIYAKMLYSSDEKDLYKLEKKLTDLYEESMMMKIECDFSHPSSISHINEYDENVKKHLYIDEDSKHFIELSKELSNYASLIRQRNDFMLQSEKEINEREKDLRLLQLSKAGKIGTAVWTTIVTGFEGFSFLPRVFNDYRNLIVQLLVGLLVGGVTLHTQIIAIGNTNTEIEKQISEIEELKKQRNKKAN